VIHVILDYFWFVFVIAGSFLSLLLIFSYGGLFLTVFIV